MKVYPAAWDREHWNRCDVCGRLIPLGDFGNGASRHMLTPDSDRSREEWETLCREHSFTEEQKGKE